MLNEWGQLTTLSLNILNDMIIPSMDFVLPWWHRRRICAAVRLYHHQYVLDLGEKLLTEFYNIQKNEQRAKGSWQILLNQLSEKMIHRKILRLHLRGWSGLKRYNLLILKTKTRAAVLLIDAVTSINSRVWSCTNGVVIVPWFSHQEAPEAHWSPQPEGSVTVAL